jgi:hypothetical protein
VTIHDDITGFGALGAGNGHGRLQEVTLSDNGQLSPMNASTGHGGSTGGSALGRGAAPIPTPVSSGNLTIDLVWDTSVASAGASETDFMNTVIGTAQLLVNALGGSTKIPTEVYIDVGWGEIGGQGMSPSALGESMTNGYLVSDSFLTSLLLKHGDTLGGTNAPSGTTQFFLPSGEAKALGMTGISTGSPSSPDGYIGVSPLGKGYSWQYTDKAGNPIGAVGPNQYSLQGDLWHELTEAMGRISMEGLTTMHGQKTYTPLDLFDYSLTNPGQLSLSNTGGYFSNDGGVHQQGFFDNAKANHGDIADWASSSSPTESGTSTTPGDEDAFNAFGYLGLTDDLTKEDIELMVALGY